MRFLKQRVWRCCVAMATPMLAVACSTNGEETTSAQEAACDRYFDALWNVDFPGRTTFQAPHVPESAHYTRFRRHCLTRANELGLTAARIERCAGAFRGRVGDYNCVNPCTDGLVGLCDLTLCAELEISDEGGSCGNELQCAEGTMCVSTSRRCERLGRAGEGCGIDPASSIASRRCGVGVECLKNVCTPVPSAGQPCSTERPRCTGAALCNVDKGVCEPIPVAQPGEACLVDDYSSCRDGSCHQQKCTTPVEDGQPCGPAGAWCRTLSHCIDGVCTPFERVSSCGGR